MGMEKSLIDYYEKNAESYFESTVSIDMSEQCKRFLSCIRKKGTIIDIGCGSGRDLKYFSDKGWDAEGIDASASMCAIASKYSGRNVECVKIEDWVPRKKYSGLWASASLAHMEIDEIRAFIERIPSIVVEGGAAYLSFKTRIKSVDDDGRHFTDVSEKWLQRTVSETPDIRLLEIGVSADKSGRKDFRWLSVIVGVGGIEIS